MKYLKNKNQKKEKQKKTDKKNESGLAIIIVILITALMTTLVVNLSHSTFMTSKAIARVDHQLQSEYLLKSLLNFSRMLIKSDLTKEDTYDDVWIPFLKGESIPPELFGFNNNNFRITLQISPQNSLMPLLVNSKNWYESYKRLFESLGFEDDGEVDHTGYFNNQIFYPNEMVGNMVDLQDIDDKSFDDSDFPGIEDQLPEDYFPNTKIQKIQELTQVPGFSPKRMQTLSNYVTVVGNLPGSNTRKVNINFGNKKVLKSLHIDFTDSVLTELDEYKGDSGAFKSIGDLRKIPVMDNLFQNSSLASMLTVSSDYYTILAEVEYASEGSYFFQGLIGKNNYNKKKLPKIIRKEFF